MPDLLCAACGAPHAPDARFCEDCGASLLPECPSCGAPHTPGKRFCRACGSALTDVAPAEALELRVASVLFVDLVGFTTLAERHDAEDTRELLSRYFDTARTIVGRYGGTVEKFIGDAVMTVWGAPAAHEDDAERAVRAGLELIDAVAAFGEEVGAPDLRARAGVVTGRVASAPGGSTAIVVGDRVNTAARVQAAAPPGAVYVDDETKRASAAAIAYEDAGTHQLKGKAEPLHLWRAERVVAGVAGALREVGLEARFVGREPELRLVKDRFHAAVEQGTARLVAVTGAPGVGKTRLRRELEHHVDGLLAEILWHSGRCPAYGDGVAYWALGEMVRQRLGIAEETPPDVVEQKLVSGLERWILAAEEREYVLPRLRVLLGGADPDLERQDLHAGWRLFFERLADHSPVVLAFEDLHWADDGLLDFIEQIVTWASRRPIFVLALARPELGERRPDWASGRAAVTPIFLEPLARSDVAVLLQDLAPDLPATVRGEIADRSEGIPLYALETIRALVDRGVLAPGSDGGLVATGEVGELAVPSTLSSLLNARLDALLPDEHTLVSDLAVWGGAFTRASAAALCDLGDPALDAALAGLVRKQVLTVQADPLSPDRGQYSFAQSLLRTVAYERLSRRERKARHLAAVRHLRSVFPQDGEEMAEPIAAHQLEAYAAAAGDPDAGELREAALAALRRAARRAEAVGAPEKAERAYRTALELADGDEQLLELSEAAAEMAMLAGRYEEAIELLQQVADARKGTGRDRDAARLAGRIGLALRYLGRNLEAIERLRAALAILDAGTFDADVAELNFQLGTALVFGGRRDEAAAPLERALVTAEAIEDHGVVCGALTTSAVALYFAGRPEHAAALWRSAAEIAERHDVFDQLMRAQANLGELLVLYDRPGARAAIEAALASARRLGDRGFEIVAAGNRMWLDLLRGNWDENDRFARELAGEAGVLGEYPAHCLVAQSVLRGDLARAREHLELLSHWRDTQDVEDAVLYTAAEASVQIASGELERGLRTARRTVERTLATLCASHGAVRQAWPDAVDAAFALGRLDEVAALISLLGDRPPGHVAPLLRAELARARGRLAAAGGDDAVAEAELRVAVESFERLGYPFWLARAEADREALRRRRPAVPSGPPPGPRGAPAP